MALMGCFIFHQNIRCVEMWINKYWSLHLGTYWLMKAEPFKSLEHASVIALHSINTLVLRIIIIISLVLRKRKSFIDSTIILLSKLYDRITEFFLFSHFGLLAFFFCFYKDKVCEHCQRKTCMRLS